MSMGVLVQQDHPPPSEQTREVPIPKKKWIKEYFTFEEKGLPDLPRNGQTSAILPSSSQNGYENRHGIISNGVRLHFVSETQFRPPSAGSPTVLPRVPESVNGFKISDHSYRRINQLSQSPTFDFNVGTNRISKNSSSSSFNLNNRNSGTREVHNKLEKNRRAHLKECFELLKSQLPAFEDRKISNLAILRSSLRHIQALKRREREYEYEMERLAREKITLQQRLSTLKKDGVGKWENLDWRAMVPEDVDVDYDTSSGPSTDTVFSENRADSLRSSESEDPNSPSDMMETQNDGQTDGNDSPDSEHPLSLTVNNCHIGENVTVKRLYGHVNGVNGISGTGPISLVTNTKLSSSPLAAITHSEKTASSPTGGATCVNNTANNSGKGLSSPLLSNVTLVVTSKCDVGQYYEEKMCK